MSEDHEPSVLASAISFDRLSAHPERDAVLGEVHARPFHPLLPPRRLLRFAFMTDAAAVAANRKALSAYCLRQGAPGPDERAKHHQLTVGGATLRWEQHSEFTTYTIEIDAESSLPFSPAARDLQSPIAGLTAPGPLLVAVDLHILQRGTDLRLDKIFDQTSLAASVVLGDAALVATDFRPGPDGYVRMLVQDRALDANSAGELALRLLEIETYRTLALLGLPEAQRITPQVSMAEKELAQISHAMVATGELDADHRLLEQLTALAATTEADASRSAFRFSASRAYNEIVQQRLLAIKETPTGLTPTIGSFLARRMAPAMRTCQMLLERQSELSLKLARSANLLRTRVDVEIERQNRDLLQSMNERTRMQLRLQQTVEGLSVAAISYYVVGLSAYVFKALKDTGLMNFDPGAATAIMVPVAVLLITIVVRRIRNHAEG